MFRGHFEILESRLVVELDGRWLTTKWTFSQISRWIKTADVAKLEHAVYMGKGAHMRGRTAWNEDTRRFLQGGWDLKTNILCQILYLFFSNEGFEPIIT